MTTTEQQSDTPQEARPSEVAEPENPADVPGAIPEPSPADGGPGGR